MLTQLSRLSVEADGRYAKLEEMQFLKSYFQFLDQRLSAYAKIRNSEVEIIDQVEAKMRTIDPSLFINAAGDFTQIWRKDAVRLLRYAAAALLFNDPDRLKEGLLLWHSTIVKSYKFDRTCKTSFEVMSGVVKQYLTTEEAALFCPLLKINGIVLS